MIKISIQKYFSISVNLLSPVQSPYRFFAEIRVCVFIALYQFF